MADKLLYDTSIYVEILRSESFAASVRSDYERRATKYDAVSGREFIDMRSMIAARLLALNPRPNIRTWLNARKKKFGKSSISPYDKALLNHLMPL